MTDKRNREVPPKSWTTGLDVVWDLQIAVRLAILNWVEGADD